MKETLNKNIEEKYKNLGEKPESYLEGLLYAKPITYWDYIEVDTLLSLQKPRTNFKDETTFIIYHQITELVLKLINHEIEQVTGNNQPSIDAFIEKLKRVNRYTELLINSFSIMKEGMNYDDYNKFRKSLTPASGYQSVQFRYIELRSTRFINLLSSTDSFQVDSKDNEGNCFENIYWKKAGIDKITNKKTLTLRLFEEQYQADLIDFAKSIRGKTLEDKIIEIGDELSDDLLSELKLFDYNYNVKWPQVHLATAAYYLDSRGENKAATGGSEWKKYLNPKFQERLFFKTLWNKEKLINEMNDDK